ncbi:MULTISPECIES: hypothetical protein [Bacillus]|uniref:Uncharacterized protein n=1 Tax=Bacillus subtilis TaxID=1423 RepID=A0AAQ3EMJ7_BACIU|nr:MULTISPECIES: hypothetical protein [Bacillus]MBE0188605.1 hypothetical protein [Bacillus subtilis]MCG3230759.1 hypothetical protein [Bacillus subtilis]MDP8527774.1 hypothetical protein [Bacillus subtilis]MEC1264129.1 hypothetical protein [Bacillus subtilis]MEC1959796.1 hypothetical protein [Bacillus subtilis]
MSKRERTSTVEKWIKEVDGTGSDYRSAMAIDLRCFLIRSVNEVKRH